MKITVKDVINVSEEQDIDVLQALTMMQAAAAKLDDEDTLEQLAAIKWTLLFGEDDK